MDIVQRAKELAHRAHAGQVDKAGRPYIEHVARVAAAVRDPGHMNCPGCDEAEAVAWLHDVLEDCRDSVESDRLLYVFDSRISTTCMDLNRYAWASDQDYYGAIRENPLALRVKLADIADNANEARLALLPPDVADRLRKKYAKARKALGVEE